MDLIIKIVSVLLTFTILSFVRQVIKRRRQPPGPLGFPFFGEKPFLLMKIYFPSLFTKISENDYFMEMKKKYGDIWSLDLGDRNIVVISSPELFKKAFLDNGKIFSGRHTGKYYSAIGNGKGLAFGDGKEPQITRKMVIRSLRELGFSKKILEENICQGVDKLIDNIETNKLRRFQSPSMFVKPVTNITSQMFFNVQFSEHDKDLDSFIDNIKTIFHSGKANIVLEIFSNVVPIFLIKRLFPCVEEFFQSLSICRAFIEKQCLTRLKVDKEFSKPICIFDYLWRYRYEDYRDISDKYKLSDITQTMMDLFFGGSDTTTLTLSFSCLILGKKPQIQEDLRQELLLSVDGPNNVSMGMKNDCPKMLSFIDEILRFCILELRIPKRAISNCLLNNYEISYKDHIYADVGSVFKDTNVFDNPNEFDAYRFLDGTKTKYISNKHLTPFGMGKRACIGEGLAMMELFLILAKLILKFNISLAPETNNKFDQIMEGHVGLLHCPLTHEIYLDKR